jgi:hypothetical protein
VIDGQRYFWLFDDAMISMTYARNLVEGHGLEWSRWRDPVEGFTHPLWTFGMVAAQLPGVPLRLRSLLVQLVSAGLLLANVLVVHHLARRFLVEHTPRFAQVASIPTAACFALNYWALVGMETGAQALLVSVGTLLTFAVADGARDKLFWLWATFTAAVLLRLDMALLVASCLAYLMWRAPSALRDRRFWGGATSFAALVGGYELFRLWYFGDPLPNTYYLKMTGGDPVVRILRGAYAFRDFFSSCGISIAIALVLGLATARERPRHVLLAALVMSYFAYSVYVGGDVWEDSGIANRFVCFVLPVLAMLVAGGLDALARRGVLSARRTSIVAAVACCWLLVDINGLATSPDRGDRLGYLTLQREPPYFAWHRRVLEDVLELDAQVPPFTRVAVTWAGIPAYFSDFEMIDMLGYNDAEVAHAPWTRQLSRRNAAAYLPGHMKASLTLALRWDPDVLFQWWPAWGRSQAEMLKSAGYLHYETGPDAPGTAGQIWAKRSIALDAGAFAR